MNNSLDKNHIFNYILIALITLCAYQLGKMNIIKSNAKIENVENNIDYQIGAVKKDTIKIQKKLSGKVATQKSTVLKTNIQGVIDYIAIEGTNVKKGDVIIQLNNSDALYKKDAAFAKYQFYLSEFEKNKILFEKNFISQTEFNKSKTEYEESYLKFQEAENYYNLHEIKAPFDGCVSIHKQSIGSIVNHNVELVTINSIEDEDYFLLVEVPVSLSKEIDFNRCLYEILVNDKIIQGKFICIEREINASTNNLLIKIKILSKQKNTFNSNDHFKVVITYGKKTNVCLVDLKAIFYIQEKPYVIKLMKDSKNNEYTAIRQNIELGDQNLLFAEVVNGLQEDDAVLLSHQYTIYEGQKIKLGEK